MFLIVLLWFLSPCHGIGPGLSRFQPFVSQERTPARKSEQNSVFPYTNEANSHTYWNCHDIPPNMTLCKSVGYSRMVLPNYLQHESLREVIQQANVWVALVNTDCHPDIQRFLCSLYAPVCLKSHQESKIPPCWELCSQVRNACLPRMSLFGFDWPDIVQCDQFPKLAESMCIPPQENTVVKCAPCEQAMTLENIASSYCMADVAFKVAIQDITPSSDGGSLQINPSPKTRVLKLIRRDGTITTNKDIQRLWKRSRHRRHEQHSTKQSKNFKRMKTGDWLRLNSWTKPSLPERSWRTRRLAWNQRVNGTSRSRKKTRRDRRFRRNPNKALHDLDGIRSLQLGCSACSGLNAFSTTAAHRKRGRWLVMGRRLMEGNTFTDQVQVTFLLPWDRSSPEFKHALNAIRTQPVSMLCPEKADSVEYVRTTSPVSSELSDAPTMRLPRLPKMELSDPKLIHEQPGQQNSELTHSSRTQSERARSISPSRLDQNPSKLKVDLASDPQVNSQTMDRPKPLKPIPPKQAPRPSYTNLVNSWSRNRWSQQQRWPPNYDSYYPTNVRERKPRRRRERKPWRKKRKDKVSKERERKREPSAMLSQLRKEPINPYSDEDATDRPNSIWFS